MPETGSDTPLSSAFLAALAEPARAKFRRLQDLEQRLAESWRLAVDAHGDIGAAEALMIRMAAALGAQAGTADLAELRVAELYLASACAGGSERAVSRFDQNYLDTVADGDDRHLARTHLLVGTPPRIAGYDGRSPLRDWTRLVVARALADQRRNQSADQRKQPDAEALAQLVSTAVDEDPQLRQLKAELAGQIKAALERAIAELDPHERNLLRLRYVHDTSVDDLAKLYNRHRVSMSRRFAKIQRELMATTKRTLMVAADIEPAELEATVALVHSRLELSLGRLLRTKP